jgi:phage I-like protein
MIAAHNLALADGHAADTDGYFDSVEDTLKINQRAPTRAVQDDDEDERFSEASRPTSGRQTAPSAIPVSRDVSPSGARQRTIRLSAAEAEAAELSGITHEEYARNRDAYRAERGGRLN